MTSEDVSAMLESLELVDDARQFNRYLGSIGVQYVIRTGKYQIPVGADYETIANLISGRR